MQDDLQKSLRARPEQVLYATILEKGMLLGLILVLITFCVYMMGVVKPYVPMDRLVKVWEMNVHQYLDQCHISPGWGWVLLLGHGDFLNFLGIALLAGVTIFCFLAIIPTLWRENDRLYAALALVEAAILSVAASGILGSGGH